MHGQVKFKSILGFPSLNKGLNKSLNKGLNKGLNLALALVLPFISYPVLAVERTAESYDDWYKIEIIIFKQNKVQESDEIWPLSDLAYPNNMIHIDDEPRPSTLGQLQDLIAHNKLIDSPEARQETPQVEKFVFKSRSRSASKQKEVPSSALDPIESSTSIEEPGLEEIGLEEAGLEEMSPEALSALFDTELIAYKALDNLERQLSSLSRSMRRSSLYEVLLHQAWQQPVTSSSTSKPILIQLGKHFDGTYEIDGTIKISRSRFLHMETDLWFTEFSNKYQNSPAPLMLDLSTEDAKEYKNIVDWESTRGRFFPVHSHRLAHSRRMRRSTLHFIDHPRFGLIVQVEKVEKKTES